jgi:calcineurin-like phosphoesterase family protein
MTNTFVVADPHFGHAGVCRFLRNDGSKLRPWDHPDDMDKALVENWNSVVRDGDRVYVLGDVVINRRCLPTIGLCKGRKVLVKGNHDIFKLKDYEPYFDDIRAYVIGKTHSGFMYIMSHIPIHPDSLGRFGVNIHGHLHSNLVTKEIEENIVSGIGEYTEYRSIIDPRYVCVSMEHTDFKPKNLNDIIKDR